MLKWLKQMPMSLQVLLASIILFILILLLPPKRDQINGQHLPWNAQFNEQGQLQALGLTIHKSTVVDAMKLYGKDVEIKIFSHKDESNKSIEAYFPVIYIGSIKAALALKIDAPEAMLEDAYTKGKKTVINTTGKREVELFNQDQTAFMQMPISSATLLPRKHLTDRAIEMRFGQADRIEVQSDNLEHRFYEQLGLELIIDPEGPEALQFYHIK
jgi:hypothetical protein